MKPALRILPVLLAVTAASAQTLTPDIGPSRNAPDFDIALAEIRSGRAADAAPRLTRLLASRESQLPAADQTTVGVVPALAALDETLWKELDRVEGDTRRQSLVALREKATVPELLTFARMTLNRAIAAEAFAVAAQKLAATGDLVSARTLYQRARAAGWDSSVPPEVERGFDDPQPATDMITDHAWWTKPGDRLGNIRVVIPLMGDLAIAASTSHVLALKGSTLAWAYPEVPAAVTSPRANTVGRYEFPLYGATTAWGIIVARTGRGLHALRATDGKSLWTSDDALPGLHVASLAAVKGRFVYILAADSIGIRPALYMLGVDLMTGRELFRTQLGRLSAPWVKSVVVNDPPLWDEAAAPVVTDDRIYLALAGGVWQLDRFDGSVLRAVSYVPGVQIARAGTAPEELPMSRHLAQPLLADRVFLVATRDTETVFAYDRDTFAKLWEVPALGSYMLVGATSSHALFQGPDLLALDLKTGQRRWTTPPRAATTFTGPARLMGDTIVVPTSKGIAALSATTGAWADGDTPKVASFRPYVSGDLVRILQGADLVRPFFGPIELPK